MQLVATLWTAQMRRVSWVGPCLGASWGNEMIGTFEKDGLAFIVEVLLDGTDFSSLVGGEFHTDAKRRSSGQMVAGQASAVADNRILISYDESALDAGDWLIELRALVGGAHKTWQFDARVRSNI